MPCNPLLRPLAVLGLEVDADIMKALQHGRDASGASAAKRIEHDAARWRDETDQVAHEFDGLHCRMQVALVQPGVALFSGGLGYVEEARGFLLNLNIPVVPEGGTCCQTAKTPGLR